MHVRDQKKRFELTLAVNSLFQTLVVDFSLNVQTSSTTVHPEMLPWLCKSRISFSKWSGFLFLQKVSKFFSPFPLSVFLPFFFLFLIDFSIIYNEHYQGSSALGGFRLKQYYENNSEII